MKNYFYKDTRILSNLGALKIKDLIDSPRELEVVDFGGKLQKTTISKTHNKVNFVKITFKNGQTLLVDEASSLLVYNNSPGIRKLTQPRSKFKFEAVRNLGDKEKVLHIRKTNPVSDVKRRSSKDDGKRAASRHLQDSLVSDIWSRNHAYVEGVLELFVVMFGNLNVNESTYARCYLWFKNQKENLLKELQVLFTFYGMRSKYFFNDADFTPQLYLSGEDLHYFLRTFNIESREFQYRAERLKNLSKPSALPFLQIEKVETTGITDYGYTVNSDTFFTEVGITGNKSEN